MTLQGDLRERAAARGIAAPDPAAETAQLAHEIRRGRRRRSLAAAAASGLCLGLVAYVGIGLAQGRSDAPPAGQPSAASGLAVLGDVGPDDVVVSMDESNEFSQHGLAAQKIVIASTVDGDVDTVSAKEIRESLGEVAEGWPGVSLVAVQPALSRGLFELSNPLAYTPNRYVLYNWADDVAVGVDPCNSTLSSFDLSAWCSESSNGEIEVDGYTECVAGAGDLVAPHAAVCAGEPGENYLLTLDPMTGDVLTTVPLGAGGGFAPWVVDGRVLVNTYGIDSGPFLVDSSGEWIQVGGGAAAGLGVVGDRLLIRTSSDVYGAESTYGHVLGLWSPSTADFEELPGTEFEGGAWVSLVDVVP